MLLSTDLYHGGVNTLHPSMQESSGGVNLFQDLLLKIWYLHARHYPCQLWCPSPPLPTHTMKGEHHKCPAWASLAILSFKQCLGASAFVSAAAVMCDQTDSQALGKSQLLSLNSSLLPPICNTGQYYKPTLQNRPLLLREAPLLLQYLRLHSGCRD